jgi:hypothetical protein
MNLGDRSLKIGVDPLSVVILDAKAEMINAWSI